MIKVERHKMPTNEPKKRVGNFSEVALGFTKEQALSEASRCLNCASKPCVGGCPVNIDIPKFISQCKKGNFDSALEIINNSSLLPAVCGRVCPQESQCEKVCTLGKRGSAVAIGGLERYCADNAKLPESKTSNIKKRDERIAIIGSGPAGLACAADLAKAGFKVTIFEALHTAGGVLKYGIPEFRLPKSIVDEQIDGLKKLGVEIHCNVVIGKTYTVDDLFEQGFKRVFISTGAGLPKFMNIPGEGLRGVLSANEFLTRVNLMKAYKSDSFTPTPRGGIVYVSGGGNVAMDAARTALWLGAKEVHIIYRRSLEELPARKEEVEHAMEEGIIFDVLRTPIEVLPYINPDDPRDPKNNTVRGLKCIKMQLGEPDEKGRRRPVEVKKSEFEVPCDTFIVAIGTSPNPLIKSTTPNLNISSHGGIEIDEKGKTSRDNVYSGGDAVTGSATVISAMGAGRLAAKSIIESFEG